MSLVPIKKPTPWIMLALLPLLGACTPQTQLTIRSEPSGATVYEGEEAWGVTPVTLDYTTAAKEAGNGCVATRPISVRWESGAKARVSTINVCTGAGGATSYTFVYPEGFPGGSGGLEHEVASRSTGNVTADGQLYYDVAQPDSTNVLKCFSDLRGDQVITHCGG
ncbi:PEGA domain-containing protein [Marinihelvus fidelis]|uniref:PEGA domain-containing protein n=1 Tax=Marinihelvus fidelis TaxID=2613842 RepID=UPI00177F2BCF|nr:PEGA domain-containing protein [Marinihelvus fidelis]